MGQTSRGIIFPSDYSKIADVPADLQEMAESIDDILQQDELNIQNNSDNIETLQTNVSTHEQSIQNNTTDINTLKNQVQSFALISETGSKVEIEINSLTYVMKIILKDKNDNVINTSNEIDLPLETMVVGARYDSGTQELVITLKNGQETRFSIADLIDGLVSQTDFDELAEIVQTNTETIDNNTTAIAANIAEINNNSKSIENITNLIDSELDTGTVEGTTIDVDDSAEWEGSLVPGANLEQKQLSGKNKLPNITNSITLAGVTYTLNEDKSITIDGTATSQSNQYFVGSSSEYEDIGLTPGDYMLSGLNQADDTVMRLYCVKKDVNNEITTYFQFSSPTMIPINEGDTFRIFIRVLNGKNVNNVTIYPQLEQGSATDYEPYCGGQASPNPNYPQDIKVVTGSNVIKHRGNNLCNIINVSGYTYSNGIPTVAGAIQIEKYDSNNVSFRATHNAFRLVLTNVLKLKPNTEYTLSYIRKDSLVTGAVARKYIYSYDNDTYTRISSNDSVDGENVKSSFTTTDSGLIALAWGYNDSAKDSSSVVSNIQIEEGSTATEFKEYRLEELPLNLSDIELCKIRDYEDTIFKNVEESKYYNSELVNSEFYKYNRIMKGNTSSLANPTVITTALADNLFECVFSIAGINKVENEKYSVISNILSSKVLGTATDTENKDNVRFYQGIAKHTASNNQIVITVDKSYLSEISAQGLVNFLEDNNFYFYYILDKSTYEQITNPTLIAQLEALLKIQMYHGENHFWVETDNLEPVMDLTYKQSNKIKNEKQNARLDNIESRLALLE